LATCEERDTCIRDLHGRLIGRRWIEVFKAQGDELARCKQRKGRAGEEAGGVVRLRGLPWSTNEYEIVWFCNEEGGCQVGMNDVALGLSRERRLTGEAWVWFESPKVAEDARRTLNRKMIGRRYIEVFMSSLSEMDAARRGDLTCSTRPPPRSILPVMTSKRYSPYCERESPPRMSLRDDRRLGGGGLGGRRDFQCGFTVLRMRGLPYHCNENHIVDYFRGYSMIAILPGTAPINDRPSGEAYVEFCNADEAFRALRDKNGSMIERRYIELFPALKQEMEFAAAGVDPKEIRNRVPRIY